LIHEYNTGNIRDTAQSQLAQMHENGLTGIRLMLWHMHSISNDKWGPIPSNGGLTEPYRTNLINYLTDVKEAGFYQLIIAFAPIWENDPMENYGSGPIDYDPAMFQENWEFIQAVRALAIQYGPPCIKIDLKAEGAPYLYLPVEIQTQVTNYDLQLYSLYADTYGTNSVGISFIAIAPDALDRLIDIYSSSGKGMPNLFMVSLYSYPIADSQQTYNLLNGIDDVMTAHGLSQSIFISETYYNNPLAAAGISMYLSNHSREISAVYEFPVMGDFSTYVAPPFAIDEYLNI